jgi:adenine-specific DNA-methyltransferase
VSLRATCRLTRSSENDKFTKKGGFYKMQNLQKTLIEILREDSTYFSENKLLKNKLTEDAFKLEPKLIKYILTDDRLKKHFFLDIDGVLVFDKDKFIQFVNDKQFLPDSYTSFKNTIGLVDENGDYFKEKKEVVLAWPYKDCVLEGGQDAEDQKRDEIFYNEILAPDEIDRLFDPKVLTNFKRYDKDGEHPNPEIGRDNNLVIKGNNLLALHSLKKLYRGKVKLIYIDPPYNTGSDDFNYNDRFNHSTWLTFMKNRLEMAKEFLSNTGAIFVQIDFNEHGYLKILCDQVFGRENFVNEIVWKRRGGKTSPDTNRLENVCDFILIYSKSTVFKIKFLYTKFNSEEYIEKQFKHVDEDGRRYRLSPLNAPVYRKSLVYNFMGYKPHPNGWSVTKEVLQKYYEEGRLVFPKNKDGRVNRRQYLDEWKGYSINSLWTDIGVVSAASKERTELMRGQKPEALIKRIVELATEKNEIIMDFFLGSGTTTAVAHKMGRRYIGIEQLDYGENDSVVRLENVIKGDRSGVSKAVDWKGGGSFIYAELKKWNQNYIDKIEAVQTTKDMLTIYEKMKAEAFFRYEVDLSKFNEQEFEKLELDQQKEVLIKCLDKNHLYVNLSEMDDTTFEISDEDKEMNRKFYGL